MSIITYRPGSGRFSLALAYLCFAALAARSTWATTPARDDFGQASSKNFIVSVLGRNPTAAELAPQLLRQAELYRHEIATRWLGAPLPEGEGRTIISLKIDQARDEGLTWAGDRPDRTCHTIYLVTSPQRALGATLKHEIAHAVLATYYPHPERLPSWLEEAIASQYDDASRQQTRQRILARELQAGRAPRLPELLDAVAFAANDGRSYAFSLDFAEFLLSLDDASCLLEFGAKGPRLGWDEASRGCYSSSDLASLERRWRRWLDQKVTAERLASTLR